MKNPVKVLREYLVEQAGFSVATIDTSSFNEAEDACEKLAIPEKNYQIYRFSETHLEAIESILKSFGGTLRYEDGKWRLSLVVGQINKK